MNQQEGKPRKVTITSFSNVAEKITVPMPAVTAETVIVGEINRKIFWPVFLVALFLMSSMLVLASDNAIAMAAAVPVPFTISATSIKSGNFRLYPGLSGADHTTPVIVAQMDATISDQSITKTVAVPGIGNITAVVSAGKNKPVVIKGLTVK